MEDFMFFLKNSNRSAIARQLNFTDSYINLLANRGFKELPLAFYNLCKYFDIDIARIKIDIYHQCLMHYKQKSGLSYMKLSNKILTTPERIIQLTKKQSNSVVIFIQLYKIYKNGLEEKSKKHRYAKKAR